MPTLKLITLNVEGNRHWSDIIPFIERETPDVVCLQEIFEQDANMLAGKFGYRHLFLPIMKKPYDRTDESTQQGEGIAFFTKLPLENTQSIYYYEPAPGVQIFSRISVATRRATIHQGILLGTVVKDGKEFVIAVTHFTWTPDGQPNENQDVDIKSLFKILDGIPNLILCGDFNVPRGDNRIYRALTERFKDNIPLDVKSTLDPERHYTNKIPVERARTSTYVIDYVFSTPEYAVHDVRVESGLSDHCAVVANVTKA